MEENKMLDLKLEKPKTTDDKTMLETLEKIAFESSLHISPEVRDTYTEAVVDWINDFHPPLAYRRQRYLQHYIFTYNKFLKEKKQ